MQSPLKINTDDKVNEEKENKEKIVENAKGEEKKLKFEKPLEIIKENNNEQMELKAKNNTLDNSNNDIFDEDFIRNYLESNSFSCTKYELYGLVMNLHYNANELEYNSIFDFAVKSGFLTPDQEKYLKDQDKNKLQWCVAFIKNSLTLGVNTNSRIEGVHAKIKKHISSSSTICELIYRLLNFEESKWNYTNDEEKIIKQFNQIVQKIPIMKSIASEKSEFAFNQCIMNWAESAKCHVENFTKSSKNFKVKYLKKMHKVVKEKGRYSCDCSFLRNWGMPCCHIFHVATVIQDNDIKNFPFLERWGKKLECNDFIDHFVKYLQETSFVKKIEKENKSEEQKCILLILNNN